MRGPQPAPRHRALIVEDEVAIRELLRLHLDLGGFALDETGDGRQALDMARTTHFDLILLDVMLPGLDGISVCRAIRAGGPNTDTPILMLTAREGESDKVLGLESGADDYLTKPFGVRELMARVGALMRRHGPPSERSAPPRGRRWPSGAGARLPPARPPSHQAPRVRRPRRTPPAPSRRPRQLVLTRLARTSSAATSAKARTERC
jgi:DNA-binding response OmpR family regulator